MQFLKRLVVALACALTLGLACLLALLIQNPETEEHEHTWIIIFLVVLLLAGILIASCLYAIFKSQHYTEENEILNKQLDHEGTMYSRTSELYERTRRLNHDLKSYLLIILGYLENAEYEQARLHLVEILDRQLKMNLIHYESSGEINAVLNDKLSYAEQHAITLDMHISGEVPREDSMNVAILLSNLLDNAMEAAEKAELRKVQLEMYEEKGMYYIDIINKVNASVLHHNPKLQSTKKDKQQHGIGLKSVRHIVKQLEGSLQMFEEDDAFHSCVSFPMQKG